MADNFTEENPELSIVILCYRAGNTIPPFVEKVIKTLEDDGIFEYELVLVGNYDKDSRDQTPKIVAGIAKQNPKIIYSAKMKEGQMGWDMRTGLALARGRYIAVIDGDGQVLTEDLVRVYKKIKEEQLDFVKTYRIKRGDSLWRRCISFFYNQFFQILFPGLKSKDINSKPKIMSRQTYKKLDLNSNDWFIDAEIMIQARRLGLKIGEVPTFFRGLEGRKSFIRLPAIIEFIKNLIIFRIKEFKYRKS